MDPSLLILNFMHEAWSLASAAGPIPRGAANPRKTSFPPLAVLLQDASVSYSNSLEVAVAVTSRYLEMPPCVNSLLQPRIKDLLPSSLHNSSFSSTQPSPKNLLTFTTSACSRSQALSSAPSPYNHLELRLLFVLGSLPSSSPSVSHLDLHLRAI
jgi:hypothetical protein